MSAVTNYLPPLPELALVALVGFGLAQATRKIPVLNNQPMVTRTLLYTLGYVVAKKLR